MKSMRASATSGENTGKVRRSGTEPPAGLRREAVQASSRIFCLGGAVGMIETQ